MSSSILSDFEWDEGITMPVANAENKYLEEVVCVPGDWFAFENIPSKVQKMCGNFVVAFCSLQVQEKQRQITQLQNFLLENDDKVNAMSEHLKNVRQELQHTQVSCCFVINSCCT